jgi:hypothetical protein
MAFVNIINGPKSGQASFPLSIRWMSWFEYVCDEIALNNTISNCDMRYMMIHFYVIDIDNDEFLAICHTFDTPWI